MHNLLQVDKDEIVKLLDFVKRSGDKAFKALVRALLFSDQAHLAEGLSQKLVSEFKKEPRKCKRFNVSSQLS
jgi:Caspase recruitment domain